ncbi:hypothetical protein BCR34DRAFT_157288 [Clohesyomyces aquaticus]|uniref:Uncharacterized protein n=1 Tax=Clohesyomyces aquaticus TaxID=1231657 RepID=A0A1Y1YK09_9PLEO|nr:hypothetical protein BCR34DRAFT_157288 [Clohesyomyces aquaticus]
MLRCFISRRCTVCGCVCQPRGIDGRGRSGRAFRRRRMMEDRHIEDACEIRVANVWWRIGYALELAVLSNGLRPFNGVEGPRERLRTTTGGSGNARGKNDAPAFQLGSYVPTPYHWWYSRSRSLRQSVDRTRSVEGVRQVGQQRRPHLRTPRV